MHAFVDEQFLADAKHYLRTELADVKPSIRVEALARALGYGSYAAARASAVGFGRLVRPRLSEGSEFLRARGLEGDDRSFLRAIAHASINEVARQNSLLTTSGYGVSSYWNRKPSEYREAFEVARESLCKGDHVDAFLACVRFLRLLKTIKTVNKKTHSYELKHDVEKFMRMRREPVYVPNGVFIAAAVYSGFLAKQVGWDSQNAWANISARSLAQVRAAIDFSERERALD